TFQDMIKQPFHQFVETWQRDPKMGLLETLGGAAIVGGAVALSGTAIGAAAIFGIGAALVLPGMINGWLNELQHPSDSNLVQALVHTATGIITVGTPGKAFAGLGTLRNGFQAEKLHFAQLIEPRGVANYISGLLGQT